MRICVFGSSGSGKSTLAARLYADLKMRWFHIEQVQEFIKMWAYEEKMPKSWDQLYVFSSQLHLEDERLRYVDHIITDSPLLMNAAYAKYYGYSFADQIKDLAIAYEKDFPAINIFVRRKFPFVQTGRFQSEEETYKIETCIHDMVRLNSSGEMLYDLPYEQILDLVTHRLMSK